MYTRIIGCIQLIVEYSFLSKTLTSPLMGIYSLSIAHPNFMTSNTLHNYYPSTPVPFRGPGSTYFY